MDTDLTNIIDSALYATLSDKEKRTLVKAHKNIPKTLAAISFGYRECIVTIENATTILKAMEGAEEVYDHDPKKIRPILISPITVNLISNEKYLIAKMNHLLLDETESE